MLHALGSPLEAWSPLPPAWQGRWRRHCCHSQVSARSVLVKEAPRVVMQQAHRLIDHNLCHLTIRNCRACGFEWSHAILVYPFMALDDPVHFDTELSTCNIFWFSLLYFWCLPFLNCTWVSIMPRWLVANLCNHMLVGTLCNCLDGESLGEAATTRTHTYIYALACAQMYRVSSSVAFLGLYILIHGNQTSVSSTWYHNISPNTWVPLSHLLVGPYMHNVSCPDDQIYANN